MPKRSPKGKRVIMDDGPPHGPGTADPSSAVQAGSCASEPGRSTAASSVVAKYPFSWRKKNKRGFFKSWLASSPPPPPPPAAGVVHFSVVLGRETRSYLIYSGWSASHPPPRFRRFTHSVPGVVTLLRAGPKQNRPHPAHSIISTI